MQRKPNTKSHAEPLISGFTESIFVQLVLHSVMLHFYTIIHIHKDRMKTIK